MRKIATCLLALFLTMPVSAQLIHIGAIPVGEAANQLGFSVGNDVAPTYPVIFFVDALPGIVVVDRAKSIKEFTLDGLMLNRVVEPNFWGIRRVDQALVDGNNYYLGIDFGFFLNSDLSIKKMTDANHVYGEYFRAGFVWHWNEPNFGGDNKLGGTNAELQSVDGQDAIEKLRSMNPEIYAGTIYTPDICKKIQALIETGEFLIERGTICPRNWAQARVFYSLFEGTPWQNNKNNFGDIGMTDDRTGTQCIADDGSTLWSTQEPRHYWVLSPFGNVVADFDLEDFNPDREGQKFGAAWEWLGEFVHLTLGPHGDAYIMAPDPKEVNFYEVRRTYLKTDLIALAKTDVPAENAYSVAGMIAQMSPADLRIMRNALFAFHGYVFQSADLKSYFGKQDWYKPNTKVKGDPVILEESEKRLFDLILAEESRRK